MNKFLLGFFIWFPIAFILPIGLTKSLPSDYPFLLHFLAALAFGIWMGSCYWFLSARAEREIRSNKDDH